MNPAYLLFCFVLLAHCQEYLPKDAPLPMSELFARDIACSGDNDFWKVDSDGWSTIISMYPVRPNTVTVVDIYLVYGNKVLFGVGQPNFDKLSYQYVVSYHPYNGEKYINGDYIDYASQAITGDTITMTVDLRPFKKTVSFAKNGISLGRAFGGLNFWGDQIYIMISIGQVGHRIKIPRYEVQE